MKVGISSIALRGSDLTPNQEPDPMLQRQVFSCFYIVISFNQSNFLLWICMVLINYIVYITLRHPRIGACSIILGSLSGYQIQFQGVPKYFLMWNSESQLQAVTWSKVTWVSPSWTSWMAKIPLNNRPCPRNGSSTVWFQLPVQLLRILIWQYYLRFIFVRWQLERLFERAQFFYSHNIGVSH